MKFRLSISSLVLISILLPLKSAAEDIDLFVGRSTADTDIPNVLVILDNTANWGPESDWLEQKQALNEAFDVIQDTYIDRVNLGLMLYTETGGTEDDSGNKNAFPNGAGAYVRSAVRLMDQAGIDALRRLIAGNDPTDPSQGLNEGDDKGSGAKSSLAMAEAYLYFLGGDGPWEAPWAGNQKVKADFRGNVSSSSPWSQQCWALGTSTDTNALDSFAADKYNSPVEPGSCGGNYIIYISNGANNDDTNGVSDARNILKNMEGYGTHPDAPSRYADFDFKACPKNEEDNTNRFCLYPDNSQETLVDEWAYFMLYESPLEIQTYAIDVQIYPGDAGQCEKPPSLAWSRLMENAATDIPDKRTYYRQCGSELDSGQFKADFLGALGGILSRNSVFASVALPAAANEQSTFLNQVYIGLFRPDGFGSPRWLGNLKQYQIGIDVDPDTEEEVLTVVDAEGESLVETDPIADNAGFVKGCARSFWTPTTVNNYWDYLTTVDDILENDPIDNCTDPAAGKDTPAASDYFDGQVVEKGGQGYTLRLSDSPASRASRVWTCDADIAVCNSASGGLKRFNTTNVSDTEVNADDADDHAELIDWAIGYDVDDETGLGDPTKMRPSVHGDIVHSQPVAKDYARDINDPEVVVFYGGNDGMLRAINGNQSTAHDSVPSVAAGHEYWAFMPSEFYGEIKRIRTNEDSIKFPASGPTEGQASPPGAEAKGYGMDGPLSLFEFDVDDDGTDEAILFAGMRRAGRTIYSFDVTSRATPELHWKIGCPSLDPNDPTNCTSGMEDLGQTWSRISLAYANGYTDASNEQKPLLIFGGGYDICEDYDDGSVENNECGPTKGNRIFILDAVSGAVVNTLETDRSVPGAVTVVPISDDNPSIAYAYAVDTGGNVYRISGGTYGSGPGDNSYAPQIIGNTPPTDWIITKIASLGCNNDSPCDANRKFLFGPDVVRIDGNDMLGVLVGSGDREKPLRDYSVTLGVQNYFYSLVDQPSNKDWLDDDPVTCGSDIICQDSLAALDPNDLVEGVAPTVKGWKLRLRPGEQVVTGAITVDNIVNFSTHIPTPPDACEAKYGTATAYNLDYLDASGIDTEFLGGGLVPTPVAGKVIIDGVRVPFCIGCGAEGSPIGVGKVGGGITWTQPRSRVFWNIDRVD